MLLLGVGGGAALTALAQAGGAPQSVVGEIVPLVNLAGVAALMISISGVKKKFEALPDPEFYSGIKSDIGEIKTALQHHEVDIEVLKAKVGKDC